MSRRAGIGFAIVRRLLAGGASVVAHSWAIHDAPQPWGPDAGGVEAVIEDLGGIGPCLRHIEADFGEPDAPERVIAPMADELPYAISKGAVHQMTRSLADALAQRGITVNTINPGPVDTGWATPELRERLRASFPAGRWATPDDIAAIVRLILDPDSAWMTGQIIDAEGGFRRAPTE